MSLFLIFLGGGLGALCRFLLSRSLTSLLGTQFPIGIMACNLLGCFFVGLATGYANKGLPEWFGPFFITGLLGGFTTFSTFSNDSVSLLSNGQVGMGLTNIVLSVVPGLLAVWFGLSLAQAN